MRACACAWAVWCALAVAGATAFTVDCNHEYADCDTELSKFAAEDEESIGLAATNQFPNEYSSTAKLESTTSSRPPSSSSTTTEQQQQISVETTTETVDNSRESNTDRPKARLLNILDDFNPLNILHNQTEEIKSKKTMSDLSDVNLDGDEEDDIHVKDEPKDEFKILDAESTLPDKFLSNLQSPFHPMSSESETCNENDISYRVGDKINRGCDETCECSAMGHFECSPRCKHPYIRRGRRINDPLCFESAVDECCSIIACATDLKPHLTNGQGGEICRYGNNTYTVGTKWQIGCDQVCTCEKNSVIMCKSRCTTLPPSDKCINVQDPNDACCEVQVCDVSQDVHEEPQENMTSTIATDRMDTEMPIDFVMTPKATMRPLVLAEPIGSVKVLQNNSVQVNLIHMNTSEDPIHLLLSSDGGGSFKEIQLKYSNLLLNLEGGRDYVLKTKETGTKFNFTITPIDSVFGDNKAVKVPIENAANETSEIGCYEDGKFYGIGEEFHIGCSELCECTGHNTRECAVLQCPSLVGIELLSRGCVRWAPTPPPQPPNCCPRTARCLSDGTCHYKGHAVPNWSEVPISLTGCEQRCFCENGELDCQEICTALPPVPPQNLRCLPGHRPAAVNISEDDCCKQWACVSNTGSGESSATESMHTMFTLNHNYVTPAGRVLVTPPTTTRVNPDMFQLLNPTKSLTVPKIIKTNKDNDSKQHADMSVENSDYAHAHFNSYFNDTVINSPFPKKKVNIGSKPPERFILSNKKIYKVSSIPNPINNNDNVIAQKEPSQLNKPPPFKLPSSHFDNFNYFPSIPRKNYILDEGSKFGNHSEPSSKPIIYFKPHLNISLVNLPHAKTVISPNILSSRINSWEQNVHSSLGKLVTVLHTKDLETSNPNVGNTDDGLWSESRNERPQVSRKNPYETLLLNAVPNRVTSPYKVDFHNDKQPGRTYSTLDLERLLNQLEIETEVGRDLGRSVEKARVKRPKAAVPHPGDFGPQNIKPTAPSFLPTLPPDMYPHDDIPDYDLNNIHRPSTISKEPPLLPGLPSLPSNYRGDGGKFTVLSLQADSPTSVKLLFGLPPFLVGLKGSVDLRYTDKDDDNMSKWQSQIFAPADDILSTSRLEFRLVGLKPSTEYRVKGKLYIDHLPAQTESPVYSIRTPDAPVVEEKTREIKSRLSVVEVNDTTVHLSWRHFTEDELQFIDGIQVRYRPVGTPIYSMTELLHHSRSDAFIHELLPGSKYEVSLVLVPPPRTTTELHDPTRIEFTTSPYVDPYNWSVTVETRAVGSEAAELSWRGIPPPAERWVRVYRAAHACGAGRTKEHDAFRLASRDQPPTITLTGLEPNARCRVWMELFLTNGKVKTSNVLEINTKSLETPETIDNVIEASSVAGGREGVGSRGDYYGALVVVGVVAALGALTSLLLLLVVVRRHRPHSVPITPLPTAPRESSLPPYDNPAYKLELQQETMDL